MYKNTYKAVLKCEQMWLKNKVGHKWLPEWVTTQKGTERTNGLVVGWPGFLDGLFNLGLIQKTFPFLILVLNAIIILSVYILLLVH